MAKTIWSSNLNTGIEAIDRQHKMIVEYINQLDDARSSGKREHIAKVMNNLVNYTVSHFEYEEKMLEQVQYPFLKAHQNVHQFFIRRLNGYYERFKRGDDISEELHAMMFNWLFGHIKHDDMDFVPLVAGNLSVLDDFAENRKGLLGKLFG